MLSRDVLLLSLVRAGAREASPREVGVGLSLLDALLLLIPSWLLRLRFVFVPLSSCCSCRQHGSGGGFDRAYLRWTTIGERKTS